MSTELKPLVAWPDKEQLILNMPQVFRKHFSKVRCIIDCFEVFKDQHLLLQGHKPIATTRNTILLRC